MPPAEAGSPRVILAGPGAGSRRAKERRASSVRQVIRRRCGEAVNEIDTRKPRVTGEGDIRTIVVNNMLTQGAA